MEDVMFIPDKSPLLLDVMVCDKFYTTLSVNVTAGAMYGLNELKSFAVIKLPSLANKDFKLLPTSNPIFKS